MSKIKNGGLDQYGAEPFEQQQFETAGNGEVKIAKTHGRRSVGGQVDISATFWSGGYALCFVPPPF